MTDRSVDHLTRLLGGRFHQGWERQHERAEDRLTRMLEETPPETQRLLAGEIRGLLDGRLCESQIRDVLLYEVGCRYAYDRDGYDASSWLRHVLDRIVERWEEGS